MQRQCTEEYFADDEYYEELPAGEGGMNDDFEEDRDV